jgi:peptidoglycan/xylan/chitin deacetylase (PgdA/CDA1 family)
MVCVRLSVPRLRAVARAAAIHLLGLVSLAFNAVCRPGPVVRWLSRRFPDVLFHQPQAGPMIALSFDDSPHQTLTPRILDLLAAHDARATFFMIGEHIPGNEAVIRRLVAEGHELGNHMMADSSSRALPPEEFERQLRQVHDLLVPFGPVRWFRPGHAWFNRRMLEQVQRHGYRCGMASVYALEFLPVSAAYAARHILRNIRPGGVIVLHDGKPDRVRTVNVLRRILPELRRRGYRMVTLSELADAGG